MSPTRDKSSTLASCSSPPSAGISNLQRPAVMNGHNRDITEHTASLMSLFARPASPPKTPITPAGFGSSTSNSISLNMSGFPLLPCASPASPPEEMDFQRMPMNTHTSSSSTNPKVYSSGSGSFISTDNSLRDTIRTNNTDHNRDETMLVQNLTRKEKDTIADVFACTPTRGNKTSIGGGGNSDLLDLVTASNIGTNDYSTFSSKDERSRLPFLKAISESCDREETALLADDDGEGRDVSFNNYNKNNAKSLMRKVKDYISINACDSKQIKATFIGALLYSLYSLVFCFAEASAITRPSHPESGLLAPMALMGAVSTLVTSPIIILVLGGDYPAPYPALDMFLAPFLAKMAGELCWPLNFHHGLFSECISNTLFT